MTIVQIAQMYVDEGTAENVRGDVASPSTYWWAPDPVTAAAKFDSFSAKGTAPTWQMMGSGRWASNPNYASEVIGIYDRMITAAEGS